jgi:hypothetical protein
MATVWAKQSGNIDIEIKNYSGGTMIQSGFDINNSGGVLKQTVNFSRNINIQSTSGLIVERSKRCYVNFDKTPQQV